LTARTLPEYVAELKSEFTQVVAGVTEVLSDSTNYDPNVLLDELNVRQSNRGALDTILSARHRYIRAHNVLKALDGAPSECRPILVRWLSSYGDKSILTELEPLFTSSDNWLAMQAIRVVRDILVRLDGTVPESTREALVEQLKASAPAIRKEAVETLGTAKVVEVIPDLCDALRDGDLKVHSAAIDALIEINDPGAVLHLIEVLKDDSEFSRRGAVEVLNAVATADAIQDLVRALSDQDWWVRVRAADALSALGGERVADAVLSLLASDDLFIRRYAVEIFNTVGDARAVEPLMNALNDPDWWVRERSIDALAHAEDTRAVPALIDLMARDRDAAPHCAKALGKLGDPRAIEPLADLARSGVEEGSVAAFEAMSMLQHSGLDADDLRLLQGLIRTSRLQRGADPAAQRGPAVDPEIGRPTAQPGPADLPSMTASSANLEGIDLEDLATGNTSAMNRSGDTSVAPGDSLSPSIEEPTEPPPSNPKAAVNSFNPKPGAILLDRFEVVEKIGSGGFGSVFLVRDIDVAENIILKILSRQISSDDLMIKRFIHELKYTRRITHRNVIRLYDFLKLEQSAYAISMEFFPGRDVSRLLAEEKQIPVERGLNMIQQFCAGLDAAHDEGIVHRDVKPANVLINDEDEIKIVDFGLASMTHDASSRLTKSGILIGSPHYMSPEQITGGDIDIRTDIYSMGIMMFEMFAGAVPFDGDSAVSLIYKHLQAETPRMSTIAPDIPTDLDDLVFECMAKEPDNRPANAGAVLSRIRALSA
jgi:serine/threonine-protein kinase